MRADDMTTGTETIAGTATTDGTIRGTTDGADAAMIGIKMTVMAETTLGTIRMTDTAAATTLGTTAGTVAIRARDGFA